MAQAGYTPISLYYSTTASTAPTSGNLVNGELAINITDGKLYYKDNGGTVQIIASKAGASGDVVGPASATDNAIVRFDGTTGKLVQNSVVTIADSTGDISGVGQLNATTLDATNIEVTNIKAKDGTAAASIADSTGVVSITANPVLSGGTANGVLYLNGSKVATSGSALTWDGTTLVTKNVNLGLPGTGTNHGTETYSLSASNPGTFFQNLDYVAYRHAWFVGVSASEGMRLDSSGNLGIGTSSPGYKLTVQGSANNENIVNIRNAAGTVDGDTTNLIRFTANGNVLWANARYDAFAHIWHGNSAERMRLDSSGNLGIGTSSPGSLYTGANNLVVGGGSGNTGLTVFSGTANTGRLFFADGTSGADAYRGWVEYNHTNNYLSFGSDGSERARITSGGSLLVGTTTSGGEIARFQTSGNTEIGIIAATNGVSYLNFGDTSDANVGFIGYDHTNNFMNFRTDGTERARITSGGEVYIAGTTDQGAYNLQVNGTGVWGAGAYVNGSDERLKDNIQTLNDGLAVVSQLRPVTFQYKPEHSKDQSVQPGFIAQELQQAMDGKAYLDGVVQSGPEYLNVAYQNLIPILTKAIQEQQALITSLTARVALLEGN